MPVDHPTAFRSRFDDLSLVSIQLALKAAHALFELVLIADKFVAVSTQLIFGDELLFQLNANWLPGNGEALLPQESNNRDQQ